MGRSEAGSALALGSAARGSSAGAGGPLALRSAGGAARSADGGAAPRILGTQRGPEAVPER
eukprot:12370170-Alexandrium_andersonii.AAC.1